jgi:hypothetical protein
MSFDLLTRKQGPRDWSCGSAPAATEAAGWGDDARRAMNAAPNYFVWWYTAKSIGLGVMASALAFMMGRASANRKR